MAERKLDTKQEKYAQNYAGGLSKTESARQAGYSFPNVEIGRLSKNRAVQDRILALQRPYVVTWKRLLIKAQKVLNAHLDNPNDFAEELLRRMAEGGEIAPREQREFLKMLKISPGDRNTSARLIIEAMSRINPKSLQDAADQEDDMMERDDAIQQILGEDASGEVASPEPVLDSSDAGPIGSGETEVTH